VGGTRREGRATFPPSDSCACYFVSVRNDGVRLTECAFIPKAPKSLNPPPLLKEGEAQVVGATPPRVLLTLIPTSFINQLTCDAQIEWRVRLMC
jgi:hypothetical protein